MTDPGDVQPFRASVSEVVLADLRERLAGTRWPEPVTGVGWSEGVDQAWLRRVVAHWESRFDWRIQEARLNAFPQFLVRVGDTRIHCIHLRGRGPRPMPLVITHGWPGSVFEMLRLVPLLANPAAHGGSPQDAFDVVVPSIPGYGFSDRPTSPGMSNSAVADLWVVLMERLGYPRFAAQGGDWGAGISTWVARKARERLVGLHLNYIPGSFRPWVEDEAGLSAEERGFLADKAHWSEEEGAYGHLQSTRPGTLGVGADGLAGRARGVDPGESPGVERLRRGRRVAILAGRATGERDPVLGDEHGGVVHPVVPRVEAHAAPAWARRADPRADGVRPLPRRGAVSSAALGRARL